MSGYKGVTKELGRFVARKRDGEHMRHLGSYDTLIEAAVAYARHVQLAGTGPRLSPGSIGVG